MKILKQREIARKQPLRDEKESDGEFPFAPLLLYILSKQNYKHMVFPNSKDKEDFDENE